MSITTGISHTNSGDAVLFRAGAVQMRRVAEAFEKLAVDAEKLPNGEWISRRQEEARVALAWFRQLGFALEELHDRMWRQLPENAGGGPASGMAESGTSLAPGRPIILDPATDTSSHPEGLRSLLGENLKK